MLLYNLHKRINSKNENDNWFLYNAFLIKIKALHSVLLPWSLASESILHSQCTFSTPWGALWPVAILQAGTCQLNRNTICILLGPHLYTWVESSNVDKVSCWWTKVPGDSTVSPHPSKKSMLCPWVQASAGNRVAYNKQTKNLGKSDFDIDKNGWWANSITVLTNPLYESRRVILSCGDIRSRNWLINFEKSGVKFWFHSFLNHTCIEWRLQVKRNNYLCMCHTLCLYYIVFLCHIALSSYLCTILIEICVSYM